jgi:hypothetical protein
MTQYINTWKTIGMIIIKRGRTTFYICDDSIVVANGDFQYSSYNTYTTVSKSNFYKFKDEILNSQPPRFTSIVDVVELSSKYEVYGYSTRKPNLDGVEYEYQP